MGEGLGMRGYWEFIMLLSAITSLMIAVMILSFAISPAKPGLNFDIFGALAGGKGEVLGVDEEDVGQAVDKAVGEIRKVPLAEKILPESKDKIIGPQKLAEGEEFAAASKSAAAFDKESGVMLFSFNSKEIMPIASLTKLMTALVFLDYNPGWETLYEIKREDRREGGKIYLFLGERVTVKDLFHLSLVASDNTSTIALARSTGLPEEEFVKKMNEKASALGLANTRFSDPIGLNNNNVSTAEEVAKMAGISLAQESIKKATLIKEYEFKTIAGKKKRVETTDYLLKYFPENGIKIIGGKTGYTDLAGYCFAGEFTNGDGREIATVVLGGQSSSQRFEETKDLAQWVYNSYKW
jgi:D-alanyl-D-alanine carboxypeptidase